MADVREPRPVNMPRWAAATAATIMGWAAQVPDGIRELVFVLAVFVGVDTITGVLVACRLRVVSSRRMSERLMSKLLAYALLIALAVGAAVVSHQWAIVGAGVAACIGIETTSMLENLSLLERHGGVRLGPAGPFIARASRYLVVGSETDPCKVCPAKGRRKDGSDAGSHPIGMEDGQGARADLADEQAASHS